MDKWKNQNYLGKKTESNNHFKTKITSLKAEELYL